jgi:hypothetical protein
MIRSQNRSRNSSSFLKYKLSLLGDGSKNVVLEKDINSPPVTGSWYLNDSLYVEDAITNFLHQSDNISLSPWVTSGTKVQNGTVKSPLGNEDVPLYDLTQIGLLYQDVSLPAGTYTQSFYYYTTHQQILATCVPDSTSNGTNRKYIDIIGTNRWQKYSRTFTLASTTTIRTLIETRTSSSVAKPTISGLGAFTGFQIEAGSVAKTRVKTTTGSATRASAAANGACLGISAADIGKIIKFLPNEELFEIALKKYLANFFIIALGQSKGFYGWKLDRLIHYISPRLKQFGRRFGYYGTDTTSTGGQDNRQITANTVMNFDNPGHWNEALSATIPSYPDPLVFDRFDTAYSSFALSRLCDEINLEIMLFTENRGGTGFTVDSSGNSWNGTLYTGLLTRIENYLTQFPNAKCIGIISDIQELDIYVNMPWLTFKGHLLNLFNNIRNSVWALNKNIPIFHTPFAATWELGDPTLKTAYYNGLRNLGSEITNYYCVETLKQVNGVNVYRSNGEVFGGPSPDNTHLSTEAGMLIADELFNWLKGFYPSNDITIPISLPVNTISPVISGSGFITEVMTLTNGTWTGTDIVYTYQWKRNGSNISGATSSTYIITASDFATNLTCVVTATNSRGSVNATSNAITIITQYSYDSFTDTNSTLIINHINNYPSPNPSWIKQSGTIGSHAQIQNNRFISIASSNIYFIPVTPPSANYEVVVKFVCVSELVNDNIGITIRAFDNDTANYYFVRYSRATTSWGLFKMVNGTSTQLGSNYTDVITVGQERIVEFKANGTNISVEINGTVAISQTDATFTLVGRGGIRGGATQSISTGMHIDYHCVRALT